MAEATLAVWKFDNPGDPEAAQRALDALVRENLVSIHDAATVSWESGDSKPRTPQLVSTRPSGALSGNFWGLLFGLIFFVPLLGAALGAATGALSGSLTDVGIDDSFVHKVRDQITPGTSAVFVLTSDPVLGRIGDAVADHQASALIYTNLTTEQEYALRDVFEIA